MKEKKQREFVYEGFGFPILLLNVTMVQVLGVWTPKINYNKLQKTILIALAHKPGALTGDELRFIRQYFEMSMDEFGKVCGVSHAAVSKWEKKKHPHVDINTERFLRLFILDNMKIGSVQFRKAYKEIIGFANDLKKSFLQPFALDMEKDHLALSA